MRNTSSGLYFSYEGKERSDSCWPRVIHSFKTCANVTNAAALSVPPRGFMGYECVGVQMELGLLKKTKKERKRENK